mmetsp:Transcript_43665/g.105884  ORF Transcript_43665/g.105884 Transcript_43665/m.105884 type:complete len:412 (+) Transcript_43665:236-1471(+)
MNTLGKLAVTILTLKALACCFLADEVHGWVSSNTVASSPSSAAAQNHQARRYGHHQRPSPPSSHMSMGDINEGQDDNDNDNDNTSPASTTRRQAIITSCSTIVASSLIMDGSINVSPSVAAVGTLPEYADTNAVIQGLTVNVADSSQQEQMIAFLTNGFDFQVLRKRIRGSVEETWLGFGPEQYSIPKNFELPVSSFNLYGGHASICLKYDSRAAAPLYRSGDDAPGDSIAFLQVGVPGYRISQMVANGGKILDAYGLVNVVSPCGLPMRGIVGISPDPMMFVGINCQDVSQSRSFYETLGFVEQDVPYSRPSKGTTMFEPAPPKGFVYMSPSPNCMGVLLLPTANKRKKITPNPVVDSLNIVYTPSSDAADATDGASSSSSSGMTVQDPSGVPVRFQSVSDFTNEEKVTR